MFNANASHPMARRAALLAVNTASLMATRAQLAKEKNVAILAFERMMNSLKK